MTETMAGLAPVVLEGRVVRLEPMAMGHLDDLAKVGLEPELWRLTVSQVASREDMAAWMTGALDEQAAGAALPFVVRDLATGRLVGGTRFGAYAARHRRVEIGWTWVSPPWQRTAVNTEAKYLLLRHAFDALSLLRVEFKTDVLNIRSRQAILRLGAVEEGVLRRHQITDSGRLRDSVYFSIIAEEWPRVREGLERRLAGSGTAP